MNEKKRMLRATAASLVAQGCNCKPDISIEASGFLNIAHDDWCALIKRRGDSYDILIDFSKDTQEH